MITACFVRAGPIRCNIRGTLCQLIFIPSPISGTRICALEAMMRKSSATASATPPPMQKPSMAAIVTCSISCQARDKRGRASDGAAASDIHRLLRAPFGVFQVKSGAERSCAAGQDNGRRIAIVLEAPGRRGETASSAFGDSALMPSPRSNCTTTAALLVSPFSMLTKSGNCTSLLSLSQHIAA